MKVQTVTTITALMTWKVSKRRSDNDNDNDSDNDDSDANVDLSRIN